jgi:hypothetical protein
LLKRAIVHIGHHKTGTKSLQAHLSASYDDLRAMGYIYPRAGRVRPEGATVDYLDAHHHLALLMCDASDEAAVAREAIRTELLEEIGDCETAIFSSEAFPNVQDLATFTSFFRDVEVEIVCYFREYLSYQASAYASDAVTGRTSAMFEEFARNFRPDANWMIWRWSEVSSTRHWRPFDRSMLHGGEVVADFLNVLGIALPRPIEQERNHSVSGNLLGFCLLVNQFGLAEPRLYPRFDEMTAIDPRFRGKFRIDHDLQHRIRSSAPWNTVLRDYVGELPLADFADGVPIFDRKTLPADFTVILDRLAEFPRITGHPMFRTFSSKRGYLRRLFRTR